MKYFSSLNRSKVVAVASLSLAGLLVAGSAFAALTFGSLTQSSDGLFTLTALDDTLLTLTSGTDAEDFTISLTGATDSSLFLASSGTAADALSISTSAGGMDLTVAGAAAGEDMDLTSNSSINLTASEAAAGQIVLSAAGTIAGNAININTTDGGLVVTTGGAANGDITFSVGDDFVINGAATSLYNIGAATTGGTIIIGGTAQTGLISLGDTAASIVTEISIGGGNGVKTAINIGDGTGANGINIGGAASTITVGGVLNVTGAITGTTSVTADAYNVTNGTTITASGDLTRAQLQAASYFAVDMTGGSVDVDLWEDATPQAADVGRTIIFAVTTAGGTLTVTTGTNGGTIPTIAGGGAAVDAAGDLIVCHVLSTTRTTCLSYAQ